MFLLTPDVDPAGRSFLLVVAVIAGLILGVFVAIWITQLRHNKDVLTALTAARREHPRLADVSPEVPFQLEPARAAPLGRVAIEPAVAVFGRWTESGLTYPVGLRVRNGLPAPITVTEWRVDYVLKGEAQPNSAPPRNVRTEPFAIAPHGSELRTLQQDFAATDERLATIGAADDRGSIIEFGGIASATYREENGQERTDSVPFVAAMIVPKRVAAP